MRVILAGGGTGGHIYPALAIASGIKTADPDAELLYIGTRGGLEADIVPSQGLPFRTITVEGISRKLSWRLLRAGFKLVKGVLEARKLVREFRPDVVVGTGGYVCGPVVLMAVLLRVPTVIHEQNALPGVTNRLLARFADKICLTFPEAAQFFSAKAPVIETGLPVRPEIVAASRERGIRELGLDPSRKTILVVGGSRGARSINRAAVPLVRKLYNQPGIQLVLVTGKADYKETVHRLTQAGIASPKGGNITIIPYCYQMEHALAGADLVVARAGAAFLSEVLIRGLPSVLIPYPFAAENHQEFNARSLERKGAAVVILDKELTGPKLVSTVEGLLERPERLREMALASAKWGRPAALADIVKVIYGVV